MNISVQPNQKNNPYQIIIEQAKDYAIFMLSPTGHVLTWNEGAKRMKGYSAEEIVGKHFSVFYPASFVLEHLPENELVKAAKDGRCKNEGWRLRKNGTKFWANVVITPLVCEGELVGFSNIIRDTTKHKMLETALRESEERYHLLVQEVKDYGIFMLDVNGDVVTWNLGAERITGYKATEILGRNFSIFYPEEAIQKRWPEQELKTAIEEGRFEETGWRVRKDGSKFWVSVVITPLYDKSGRLTGFSKVTRDITEQKASREKLKTANRELEEANKELNTFIDRATHDLRTPLPSILGLINLLKRETLADATMKIVRYLEVACQRMDNTLLLLLKAMYLKNTSVNLTQINLCGIIEAVINSFEKINKNKIKVQINIPDSCNSIFSDKEILSTIFHKLIDNAIIYRDKSKAVSEIRIKARENGSSIQIEVGDNGIGIAPELVPKITSLFFKANDSAKGFGLGLFTVKTAINKLKGTYGINSSLGVGTTFYFTIPKDGDE